MPIKFSVFRVASRYFRSVAERSLAGDRAIREDVAQQARLKGKTLYLPALYRTGLEVTPLRPSGAVWKISPNGSIEFLHAGEH